MRIGNLSAEELAKLLEFPLDAVLSLKYVHERLRDGHSRFGTDFMNIDFDNLLSGISDDEVNSLMELSVEEVEKLRTSGELQRMFPFLSLRSPDTDSERLYLLRELLQRESEFRTRYPAAYEVLFGRDSSSIELTLPSFGVTIPDLSWSVGSRSSNSLYGNLLDAYTVSRSGTPMTEDSTFDFPLFSSIGMDEFLEDALVDRTFKRLSKGQARGLLLAIFTRAEYSERIETEAHLESVRLMAGAPTQASIRLTDLRLASSLSGMLVREKKKSLEELLDTLGQPITHAEIVSWKLNLLISKQGGVRDYSEQSKDYFEGQKDERSPGNLEAEPLEHSCWISFVAASLLLMLDLQMFREQRSVGYLAKRVGKLATLLRGVESDVAKRADNFESLFNTRQRGRPPRTIYKKYGMLLWYRSGRRVRDILDELEINPVQKSSKKESGVSGTRQWKSRLFECLSEGSAVERERYPEMYEVLSSEDTKVFALADYARNVFKSEGYRITGQSPLPRIAADLNLDLADPEDSRRVAAYIQLGYCRAHGRSPYPLKNELKLERIDAP